jgi:hypothetical protein
VRNKILVKIKIDGKEFTLEQTHNEEFISRVWDRKLEVRADSNLSRWETPGGAAQALLYEIEDYIKGNT